jgi:hypothetical protein
MDNKFNFKAIKKQFAERVRPAEMLYQSEEHSYVKYGEYNDFPNHLIDLYNNSSIHSTCVNSIVDGIVGEGLVAEPEFVLDRANPDESWNQVFHKLATDFKLFGGYAFEVVYNRNRTKVAAVYHIDFSWLRAKEMNYRGKVEGYYISDEWGEKYRYYNRVVPKDIPYLPVYNPAKAGEEPKQIYVYRPYAPGQKYYPLPDYVGALRVIDLDEEVDNFHLNNIKNGLAPSLSITTFTNADPDQRQAIEQMLREQYAGTDNAGALLYMDLDDPANAPVITPIPQNGADGYYTTLSDITTQKILTAHRITSPMILGIKTAGQLGGREEVLDAYLLLVNTVIRPYQQTLLASIEEMLEMMHPEMGDITVGVQQLKLFADGEEETDVVTSAEAEVGEDAQLEQKIETADREAGIDSDGIIQIPA